MPQEELHVRITRAVRVLSLAAATAIAAVGLASPASAAVTTAPVAHRLTTNNLVVNQDAAGNITIAQGQVLSAGQVIHATFTTAFPAGELETLQLNNGATLQQVDTEIALAGQGGATGAGAMQWFTMPPAHTTFFGLGKPFASPSNTSTYDVVLAPGKYIVTQLRISGNVKPSTVAKTFTVVGTQSVQLPVVGSKVTVTNANAAGTNLFTATSTIGGVGVLHNGPVTFQNKTGSIVNPTRNLVLFDFTPVPAGTTQTQACAIVAANGPGNAASFGTVSTQFQSNGYLNVPLGSYFVTSWVPKSDTGTPPAVSTPCEGSVVQVS